MSAFLPPTGSARAAGSSNTPASNDVSSADVGAMNEPQGNPESDTSGDSMSMGQLQPSYSPPGQQAPQAQHNYTPTGTPGQYAHHAPGHMAPAHRPNVSTAHGVSHAGLNKVIAHLRGSAGKSKSNGAAKGPGKK